MNPDLKLIKKYNVPGPRYTSYPTAVQFRQIGGEEACGLDDELEANYRNAGDISLYFHIPFCFSLCWFCGCTKIISRDTDRGDLYLDYLEKEMDLAVQNLGPTSRVIQIHFGGGTPTFLRPDQLLRLGAAIRDRFNVIDSVEYSVEIDPRRCTREHFQALAAIGCNRASIGVQDTNREVQEAIHRIQPFEMTAEVVTMIREAGIDGINFDLIYGLPRQTPDRFRRTMADVMSLTPDRLAVYSYAHLPHLMPAQKLLDESEFPSTEQKLQMIAMAVETLPGHGMRYIGMDHFAREDDSLSRALDRGTLQRNFQGYSTCARTDMLAFGMSGISQFVYVYYQNSKDLGEYYRALDEERAPVVRKLQLSRDDRIRRDLIMQIMCQADLETAVFSAKWGIDFDSYFAGELNRLVRLEEDGLATRLDGRIHITEEGRLFLRNIAMVFDPYLTAGSNERRFSKTV